MHIHFCCRGLDSRAYKVLAFVAAPLIGFLAVALWIVLLVPVGVRAQSETPPSNIICPTEPITDTSMLDPEWAAMCSACLNEATPTTIYQIPQQTLGYTPISTFGLGSPTPTISGTVTVTVTPTATVTETPTPYPTPGLGYWAYFDGLGEVQVVKPGSGSYHVNDYSLYGPASPLPQDSLVKAIVFRVAVGPAGSCQIERANASAVGHSPSIWGLTTSDDWTEEGYYCFDYEGTADYTACDWYAERYEVGAYQVRSAANAISSVTSVNNAGYNSMDLWYPAFAYRGDAGDGCANTFVVIDQITTILYGNPPIPTPTPTPFSTPTATPEMIDCSTPLYRDDTPAVTVTPTDYLGQTCPIDWAGMAFSVPAFMGIGPIDINIPSLHLCVDWYSFPSMTIFEVEFTAAIAFFPLILFAILFIMRV